ncbi:MAG TPA: carboxypeptidase-like regulatory domain-containing protein [Candidatus Limnocylindria bacterium]
MFRFIASAVVALALILSFSTPASADTGGTITGTLKDANGNPVADVCVWLGPVHLATNCTLTDANGNYTISGLPLGLSWPITYHKPPIFNDLDMGSIPVLTTTPVSASATLPTAPGQVLPGPTLSCSIAQAGTVTQTLYLPNVTKTFGGASGFQTPFIVQNTGVTATIFEITFYKFSDGSCVTRRASASILPGASFADVPNNDTDLPDNAQFSVVVRSFGSTAVSVVNQHKGTVEADAYSAASTGATTVYLPNVVRKFFGFHSPAIIQNLSQIPTTVTATYVSFDGSAPAKSFTRNIGPGQSQFIEPNSDDPTVGAPGLVDGKQYAVTLTSAQPISVVLNTHNDDAGNLAPYFYSANGITAGAASVYGAYAVKNANGSRSSSIVVQNLGTAPVTPTLTFTPLGGGTAQTITAPSPIAFGSSWAFDPRFTVGTSTACSTPTSTCLGDGEYSFVASASGGSIAAVVNVIGPASAMGYSASATPAAKYFLPNVLSNYGGWNTPVFLQGVSATSATLTWTPFTGGAPVSQSVSLPAGGAMRIDPQTVPGLTAGLQYSVVVDAGTSTVAAIVMELNSSGQDNAMIYGGFPAP